MNGHRAPIKDIVRRARLDAGLTQEQLAQRSGASVATVRNIENGTSKRPYKLREILDVLGVDEHGEPVSRSLDLSVLAKGDLSEGDRRILREMIERNRR